MARVEIYDAAITNMLGRGVTGGNVTLQRGASLVEPQTAKQLEGAAQTAAVALAPEGQWRERGRTPLKRSIKGRFDRQLNELWVESVAPHAAAIEFGADPHPITPRSGNLLISKNANPRPILRIRPDGVAVRGAARHVDHPGNPPQSFLRRALQEMFPGAPVNSYRKED